MDDAVINASPLIFLSRGRQSNLLTCLAKRILVPEPVAVEIRRGGPTDAAVQALEAESWLQVVPALPIPDVIAAWGLGPGESSVLAIAYDQKGTEAIIDDLAGRRCAAFLGIPVRGTLGIVLTAKQRGIIPEARPVMESLIRRGLYLSPAVLARALKRVGE